MLLSLAFDVLFMVIVTFTVNKTVSVGRRPSFFDFLLVYMTGFGGFVDGSLFFKHMNTDFGLAGVYGVLSAANLTIAVWGYSVLKRAQAEV